MIKIDDVAGEDRYLGLVGTYFRESDLIVVIYDVTDIESYYLTKSTWIPLVRQESSGTQIILVGNKIDCGIAGRKVSYLEASSYAQKENLLYFEISAKDIVSTKLWLKKLINVAQKNRVKQKN